MTEYRWMGSRAEFKLVVTFKEKTIVETYESNEIKYEKGEKTIRKGSLELWAGDKLVSAQDLSVSYTHEAMFAQGEFTHTIYGMKVLFTADRAAEIEKFLDEAKAQEIK